VEPLFFAGEGDELKSVEMSCVAEDSGELGSDGDSTCVVVGAGGGAGFGIDTEVETIEMGADDDSVATGSGEGRDDVLAGRVFGDSSSFWKGVIHEFHLEGFVLFELCGEGFASGSTGGGERVAGGEAGEKLDGLPEMFGVGGIEGSENLVEVHELRLAYSGGESNMDEWRN